MLSPGEAAKQVGRTRQSLMKAIRDGRLSATRDAEGRWQIDPAELFRVYPPAQPTPAADSAANTDSLQAQIALLKDVIEDLRQDRDRWREQATRLLPPSRRSWWQRLWGG
jgi:hypothetical protein